jgi:hypothetical protein
VFFYLKGEWQTGHKMGFEIIPKENKFYSSTKEKKILVAMVTPMNDSMTPRGRFVKFFPLL